MVLNDCDIRPSAITDISCRNKVGIFLILQDFKFTHVRTFHYKKKRLRKYFYGR